MTYRYGELSWNGRQNDPPSGTRLPIRRRESQARRPRRLPTVELAGVTLHAATENQAIAYILTESDEGRGGVVVTPNLDHLRRCSRDLQFHAMVSEADLAVADGMPLIWASRIQGTPLPERVAGSSLISTLNAAAIARGKRVFLLGGSPGAAEGAAAVLRERHPGAQVELHVPPLGFEHNPKQWAEMEKALLDARPDIVWVAMGSPKQEHVIYKLRESLPKVWWLGVGISLSFLAGHVRRAPRWMQKIGLEWVHRLLQEPSRLWKRYLVVGLPFGGKLLGSALLRALPTRLNRWRYGSPAFDAWPELTPSNGQSQSAPGEIAEPPAASNNGHSYLLLVTGYLLLAGCSTSKLPCENHRPLKSLEIAVPLRVTSNK